MANKEQKLLLAAFKKWKKDVDNFTKITRDT